MRLRIFAPVPAIVATPLLVLAAACGTDSVSAPRATDAAALNTAPASAALGAVTPPAVTPPVGAVVVRLTVGATRALTTSIPRIATPAVSAAKSIRWASVDPAVVAVDANGVAKGIGTGTGRVVASTIMRRDTTWVVVTAPVPPMVVLTPGQSIQAAVNANPAGTTFFLKAGTYVRQSVIPKSGDTFRGEGAGTILTGQGVTQFAFTFGQQQPYPNDVTITNLVVTQYAPPFQTGAIQAGLSEDGGGARWTLDSLDVSDNGYLGVRVGTHTHLLRSRLVRNASMGYGGIGDSVLIEGNEIAYNNPTASNMDFEGGGGKLVKTRWAVLRNNYSHHNGGVGLWTDIDNRDVLYEGNRVEYNVREGIAHETNGPGCVIRNNVLTGNGQQDVRKNNWLWGAGIGVHASPGVEVYGNTLRDNATGIALIQQARGSGAYGQYLVQDVYVHDNTIDVGTTWEWARSAGAVSDVDGAIYARNNRFERNTYTLGQNPRPFNWAGDYRRWSEWRGYGVDASGTAVMRTASGVMAPAP